MENANIKELLEKLQTAKSAEELIEMAKAEGAEIAPDKAEELFAKLNAEGEISDEYVEAIAGGRCFRRDRTVISDPVKYMYGNGKIYF